MTHGDPPTNVRLPVLLFTLQEMIWSRFIYVHQLLFGAIIVIVVLFMPRGILGVLQQKYNLPRTI